MYGTRSALGMKEFLAVQNPKADFCRTKFEVTPFFEQEHDAAVGDDMK